jgi:outer membrane receptor protein involved in Fe transport|tara:strand:- start:3014 stop:5170 length:2157 start_codon:yes stop_codon:yes gene_type:complete
MNHKFLRTYFSVPLLVLTVTFLSFSSYADENAINSDESAKQEVEEILVTANRTEQSISDVAQAVQALSGDDLQDLQITDFEQMINLIPGAVQNSTISQGSNVYSMRGVAASETDGDATVGYYLDNFAFSIPGRPFAPVTDIYDTERVEVLRGPSGTLYGLGSLGGTIKVITKDPVIGEFEGSFKATLADIDDGDSSHTGDLMINIPLTENAALRGVLSIKDIGGWAEILPTNQTNGNPYDGITGRLKLLVEPTENLSIKLTYWYQDSEQDFANRLTYPSPPAIDNTFGETYSDFTIYIADIEYDLGFATLQSTTGYMENTIISNNGGFIPGIGDFSSLWPLESENFNEDLRLTSNSEGSWNWIVGFFYQDGETFGGQDVLLPDFGFNSINASNLLKSESWAFYGEANHTSDDEKWVVTIGGRYYEEKRTFVENSAVELLPLITGAPEPIITNTVGVDSATNDTFNPRLNIAYHPTDNSMVYFEAAKGFRSGSITSKSIMTASNATLGGTDYDNSSEPDTLWNYTVGGKWDFGSVSIDVSAFFYDWSDAQVEVSPALQSIVIPVADIEGRGIDVTIAWDTPIDGLSLYIAANTNEIELDNVDEAIITKNPFMANGSQLPGTSKSTYSVIANYARSLDNGMILDVNAVYSARDGIQSVFDGRIAPSVELLNASIGIARDSWKLGLFGRNLTQEEGPSNMVGGQHSIPFPRTLGISFDKNF